LIAQLARDAVQHAHAMTAARQRRHAGLKAAARKEPNVPG
jgi:hypothetical protein